MSLFLTRLYNKMLTFAIRQKCIASCAFVLSGRFVELIVFAILGIKPLILASVISCIWYVYAIVANAMLGDKLHHYVVTHLEIMLSTIVKVVFIGAACGAQLHLVAYIPIGIYLTAIMSGQDEYRKMPNPYVVAFLDFAIFSVFSGLFELEPIVKLSASTTKGFFVFYAVSMFVSIIAYCYIYVSEVQRIQADLIIKNSELMADARKDPLTGLLNRRGFMPLVKTCVKENKLFSVAMCDIDNFKHVNDTYGHDAGDMILRNITAIIQREANGYDVCRWGGEEIIVLFDGLDINKATHIMELVRQSVEKYVTVVGDKEIKGTMTIGGEQHRMSYHEVDDASKIADNRLYYGKTHGKNVVINQTIKEEDSSDENEA